MAQTDASLNNGTKVLENPTHGHNDFMNTKTHLVILISLLTNLLVAQPVPRSNQRIKVIAKTTNTMTVQVVQTNVVVVTNRPPPPPVIIYTNAVLAWNANTDGSVAGYTLYQGVTSGNYSNRTDCGTNLTKTITNIVFGKVYYFVVTAYNSALVESTPSAEIQFLTPNYLFLSVSNKMANLMWLSTHTNSYVLQGTTDMKNWVTLKTFTATNIVQRFSESTVGVKAFRLKF